MKIKLATAIMMAGALQSGFVSALGLGDIDVSSGLNERLSAEIPLVNTGSLDASQILVRLAPNADFARADVERPYFLNNLTFDIRNSGGRPVLRVSTPEVLREPFLNFLVEVRWPSGRMLREYVVLLDLPIYSARNSDNRQQPSGSDQRLPGRQLAAVSQPKVRTSFEPKALTKLRSSSEAVTEGFNGSSYKVKSNDSLSKIAKVIKPAGLNLNQAMLALQKANPSAFIDNNINLLKAGAVLRLPDASEINRINSLAANDSVVQQEKVWRNRVRKPDADLRPTQDARFTDTTAKVASSTTDGKLTLSSDSRSAASLLPSSGGSSADSTIDKDLGVAPPSVAQNERMLEGVNSSNTGVVSTNEISKLQTELASSLENLDRASLENQALEGRIDDVESKFGDLEKLIELKNKELEAMRASLELRQQELENTGQVGIAPTTKGSVLEQIASALSVSVTALLGGLAGLVAVLLGLFIWLGSRGRDEYSPSVFESPEGERPNFNAEPAVATPAVESVTEPVAEAEEIVTTVDEVARQAANDIVEPSKSDDPLAEADIYLAYGRHAQAVNMLAVAIEAEPLRTDLRMKLLEVYHDQGDVGQVDAQKAQIMTLDSGLEPEINTLLGLGDTDAGSSLDDFLAGEGDLHLDANLDGDLGGSEPVASPVDAEELESEVATKLDLARAYFDMGDFDGAKEILSEVLEEGTSAQQGQAKDMLSKLA